MLNLEDMSRELKHIHTRIKSLAEYVSSIKTRKNLEITSGMLGKAITRIEKEIEDSKDSKKSRETERKELSVLDYMKD